MAASKDWSVEIFVGLLGAATIVSLVLIDYNEGLIWACGSLWLVFGPFIFRDFIRWLAAGRPPKKPRHRGPWVDRYGESHWAERAKYAEDIRQHGGLCMEKVCVMSSRRIAPGAYWHLAHDHAKGGAHDYLGPAHPECNEAEARGRGVTWVGMDDARDARWAEADPQSKRDPWAVNDRWDADDSRTEGDPWDADDSRTEGDPWAKGDPWASDVPPSKAAPLFEADHAAPNSATGSSVRKRFSGSGVEDQQEGRDVR